MTRMTSWEMQARARKAKRELADRQKVTIRCAHCPQHSAGRGFKFTGTVSEGRRLFEEHRATVHPDLPSPEQAKVELARKRRAERPRGASLAMHSFRERREFLTPEELRKREVLRRTERTDLLPLRAEDEAA